MADAPLGLVGLETLHTEQTGVGDPQPRSVSTQQSCFREVTRGTDGLDDGGYSLQPL